MLDIYRIKTRLGELRKRILILRRDFSVLTEEMLLKDENLYASAERHLEVAIQACLDIANHLVSSLGLERPKQKPAEVFRTLAGENILEPDLAELMAQAVGYRNVLVHEYLLVDRHLTYLNIQKGLDDLVRFGKLIEEFLEKQGKKNPK